jgi:Fic family protein
VQARCTPHMPNTYRWSPITDLGDNPNALTDGELESLQRVWRRQKDELIEPQSLEEFEKRLRREWSIETGIIENVYTLDRGITKTLIEKGIDAALIPHGASDRDSTLVARIIQDHYDALEGMFDFVGGQRDLSTSYIKELHAALLRNQSTHTVVDQFGQAFEKPLEKGQYKTAPNSPTRPDGTIHEYCPPEQVASEMDRLVSMYEGHQPQGVPLEVEAAWLHHRFTQIHPFADGNGRVARAVASLVFIKAGWFPLIVDRDQWDRYVEALEKADHGDLRSLVALFVEAQRNVLIQAADVGYEVKPIASADEAISAARDRLLQRGRLSLKEWLAVKETANQILRNVSNRFAMISTQLANEIGTLGKGFSFSASAGTQGGFDEIRARIVQKAGQTADFGEYNATAHLRLNTDRTDSLDISFQAIGPRFRGIIGVISYLSIQGTEPTLVGSPFQINYEEDTAHAQGRFSEWLERVIVEGLGEWRRTL